MTGPRRKSPSESESPVSATRVRGESLDCQGSSYTVLTYEVDDPVAVITLNRPAALNAWTSAVDDELREALGRAEQDPRVVGIVVTGAGRAFSAGADLSSLASVEPDSEEVVRATRFGEHGDFDGRLTFPMSLGKPVIAAINGPVVGMSMSFALACDLRVLSPQAMFMTAFAQRGLVAEWGLSWLLPRIVRPSVALDLMWAPRRVEAQEAVNLGLGDHLVPADELLPFCRRYVENLADTTSPTSIAVIKRQVYSQLHLGLGNAERDAKRLMLASFEQADFREGITAHLEKRSPNFTRWTGPGAAGDSGSPEADSQ